MINKHKVIAIRGWDDPEPDTFSVSLETDEYSGKAAVVVSGNATWLTSAQAVEAAWFMIELAGKARWINAGLDINNY